MLLDEEALAETLTRQGVVLDTVATSATIRAPLPTPMTVDSLPLVTVDSVADANTDLVFQAELGRGGMGVIVAAHHRTLDRDVAVKRLLPDAPDGELEALLREAQITSQLDHPNIVPVHFVGRDQNGEPLVMMKRVRGETWVDILEAEPAPRGSRLVWHLQVLLKVAQALEFAHSRGVVHRDVKPDNVMVGDYGEVYLVDWGVACRPEPTAMSDAIVGTPAYMAPEMICGLVVDARTDVYLLGATLHVVLTGRARHDGDNMRAVLRLALEGKAHDYEEDVPTELAAICNRACEVDPDDRFADTAGFRAAIEGFLEQRAANAILQGAEKRCALLVASAESLSTDDAELRSLFDETRFAFDLDLGRVATLESRVEWT